MPAAAAADWTHLAHHFARFGVLNEVSMPQMVYMLVSGFLWTQPALVTVVVACCTLTCWTTSTL